MPTTVNAAFQANEAANACFQLFNLKIKPTPFWTCDFSITNSCMMLFAIQIESNVVPGLLAFLVDIYYINNIYFPI